jgi:hypothetical protein
MLKAQLRLIREMGGYRRVGCYAAADRSNLRKSEAALQPFRKFSKFAFSHCAASSQLPSSRRGKQKDLDRSADGRSEIWGKFCMDL